MMLAEANSASYRVDGLYWGAGSGRAYTAAATRLPATVMIYQYRPGVSGAARAAMKQPLRAVPRRLRSSVYYYCYGGGSLAIIRHSRAITGRQTPSPKN